MKILGIEVLVIDDGKEKPQSFEASIEKSVYTENGHINFDATSYGSTENEAVENLGKLVLQISAPEGE